MKRWKRWREREEGGGGIRNGVKWFMITSRPLRKKDKKVIIIIRTVIMCTVKIRHWRYEWIKTNRPLSFLPNFTENLIQLFTIIASHRFSFRQSTPTTDLYTLPLFASSRRWRAPEFVLPTKRLSKKKIDQILYAQIYISNVHFSSFEFETRLNRRVSSGKKGIFNLSFLSVRKDVGWKGLFSHSKCPHIILIPRNTEKYIVWNKLPCHMCLCGPKDSV